MCNQRIRRFQTQHIISRTLSRKTTHSLEDHSPNTSMPHLHDREHFPIVRLSVPQPAIAFPIGRGHIRYYLLQSRSMMRRNSIYLWRRRPACQIIQIHGPPMVRIPCKVHFSHEDLATVPYVLCLSTFLRRSPIEPIRPPAGRASNRLLHLHVLCLHRCRAHFPRIRSLTPALRRT